MITGAIKNKVDKIWTDIQDGGWFEASEKVSRKTNNVGFRL
jgi:hypothetical protein